MFKKIGIGIGGLVVVAALVGCSTAVDDADTAADPVTVEATAVPELVAGVDYPVFDTVEELRVDVAARLTAAGWGEDAQCIADGIEAGDMRFTFLIELDDIEDGRQLPRQIVALPSFQECVS